MLGKKARAFHVCMTYSGCLHTPSYYCNALPIAWMISLTRVVNRSRYILHVLEELRPTTSSWEPNNSWGFGTNFPKITVHRISGAELCQGCHSFLWGFSIRSLLLICIIEWAWSRPLTVDFLLPPSSSREQLCRYHNLVYCRYSWTNTDFLSSLWPTNQPHYPIWPLCACANCKRLG